MTEAISAGVGAMLILWLVAMLGAPLVGRARKTECEALGTTSEAHAGALRIRSTLITIVCLCCGGLGLGAGPAFGIDPLLGGAIGLLVSIPISYLVLAIANKIMWRGFNDRFAAVRQLARKRRVGTA